MVNPSSVGTKWPPWQIPDAAGANSSRCCFDSGGMSHMSSQPSGPTGSTCYPLPTVKFGKGLISTESQSNTHKKLWTPWELGCLLQLACCSRDLKNPVSARKWGKSLVSHTWTHNNVISLIGEMWYLLNSEKESILQGEDMINLLFKNICMDSFLLSILYWLYASSLTVSITLIYQYKLVRPVLSYYYSWLKHRRIIMDTAPG